MSFCGNKCPFLKKKEKKKPKLGTKGYILPIMFTLKSVLEHVHGTQNKNNYGLHVCGDIICTIFFSLKLLIIVVLLILLLILLFNLNTLITVISVRELKTHIY